MPGEGGSYHLKVDIGERREWETVEGTGTYFWKQEDGAAERKKTR